ncbi:MAG: hypothetical protein N3B14_00705 [Thermoleophilia bacterium]|nr:hypothetical protein [Thermoleophilia bacterium]
MTKRRSPWLLAGVFLLAALLLAVGLTALAAPETAAAGAPTVKHWIAVKTVHTGETWVLPTDGDTYVRTLIVEPGGVITVPNGYSVSMTIKAVETGQKLVTTAGVDTAIQPGTYRDVWLNVRLQNLVPYVGPGPGGQTIYFPFRQALFVDKNGVAYDRSVTRAIRGGVVTSTYAKNIAIRSTGECFNGIYVTNGGTYTVRNASINLEGNGRSDFIGYGAAIVANGASRLVVDRSTIVNKGVVRTGVVADGGSTVVVKNSTIKTYAGKLPPDYVQTIDTTQMRSIPWMLGMDGTKNNVRATNLLGTRTKAAYINSYIYSSGWGVLSTDGCTEPKLVAINSTIATGPEGYGSYVIGNATEYFLGCTLNVGTYAAINRGGTVHYGPSTAGAVKRLNKLYGLGLTADDLKSIQPRETVINSGRFGVMWHGEGAAYVTGETVFNTKEAVFLDKGQKVKVVVDGTLGAQLNPANGVIFQLMDDDDPGPVPPAMTNTGVYKQPTNPIAKNNDHDIYNINSGDAICTFRNIDLVGNFYNGMRGDLKPPFPPGAPAVARNLVVKLYGSSVTGVITAAETLHYVDTITSANYQELGRVYNTPKPALNNGVLVYLSDGSVWTVTGTSYLTKLVLGAGCQIQAPAGKTLKMTVNGAEVTPEAGHTYTGDIVILVQ